MQQSPRTIAAQLQTATNALGSMRALPILPLGDRAFRVIVRSGLQRRAREVLGAVGPWTVRWDVVEL
jgi:hypothetical protein